MYAINYIFSLFGRCKIYEIKKLSIELSRQRIYFPDMTQSIYNIVS